MIAWLTPDGIDWLECPVCKMKITYEKPPLLGRVRRDVADHFCKDTQTLDVRQPPA